jgi:UDP-glucose 4-epimerase
MNSKKVVLVTGISSYWGVRAAAKLHLEPDLHVIGLDQKPPCIDIEGLDYVEVGIENPLLSDFLIAEGVDVICHLGFLESVERNAGMSAENVNEASAILQAGRQAGVRQIVLMSSTAVYGAHADNPALLTEDMPLRGSHRYGYTHDWLEAEAIVETFRDEESETSVAVLRFANIVGSSADTPFTRFLNQPNPVILLGFDPVMQFIHEQDVVEALAYAVMKDADGPFNIAADGTMPLTRMMRLIRRRPMPIIHPFAYRSMIHARKWKCGHSHKPPIEWDYLRFPWVTDTSKMHSELGFSPTISSEEALLEYAGRWLPDSKESEDDLSLSAEAHMREIMQQRENLRAGAVDTGD